MSTGIWTDNVPVQNFEVDRRLRRHSSFGERFYELYWEICRLWNFFAFVKWNVGNSYFVRFSMIKIKEVFCLNDKKTRYPQVKHNYQQIIFHPTMRLCGEEIPGSYNVGCRTWSIRIFWPFRSGIVTKCSGIYYNYCVNPEACYVPKKKSKMAESNTLNNGFKDPVTERKLWIRKMAQDKF